MRLEEGHVKPGRQFEILKPPYQVGGGLPFGRTFMGQAKREIERMQALEAYTFYPLATAPFARRVLKNSAS